MASFSSRRNFSLLSIPILLSTLFLAPACSSARPIDVNSNAAAAEKVSLALYYETLCPYSAMFIVDGLASIFDNGLIDIVDLKLVPWGNARVTPTKTFQCQHGKSECLLNTVEACALNVWPSLSKNFPFIYCVEKLAEEGKYTQWKTCFDNLGYDPKPINDCYSSGNGTQLELKYADETDHLQPPHEYVPWVTVDRQPLGEDYMNFTSYVCKAYKGPLPPACSKQSFDNVLRQKTDRVHPVSYNEKTTKVSTVVSNKGGALGE